MEWVQLFFADPCRRFGDKEGEGTCRRSEHFFYPLILGVDLEQAQTVLTALKYSDTVNTHPNPVLVC